MDSTKSDSLDLVESLVENGKLAPENVQKALEELHAATSSTELLNFMHRLMAIVAGVFAGIAVIFFVAANWQLMGLYFKFAVVQIPLLLSVVAYITFDKPVIKQSALILAFLTIGGAFALFGQTYQTGADPWQLFFNWALLGLPFVLISRTQGLHIIWAIVANLAFFAYAEIWLNNDVRLFYSLLLNTAFLMAWQTKANRSTWIKNDWASVAVIAYLCVLWTICYSAGLWGRGAYANVNLLLSIAGLCATAYYYRQIQLNKLILIISGLSGIVCANATLFKMAGRSAFDGVFLVSFMLTIGLGFWLAKYVKSLPDSSNREERDNG